MMSAADRREKAQSEIMRRGIRQKIRKIALTCASAAAMLVFVPWVTLKINDKITDNQSVAEASAKLCEVSTRNGETREVILPDNSRITLNAGSVLIYPEKFSGAERTVFLSGEAIFEVTHNEELPFVEILPTSPYRFMERHSMWMHIRNRATLPRHCAKAAFRRH